MAEKTIGTVKVQLNDNTGNVEKIIYRDDSEPKDFLRVLCHVLEIELEKR